MMNVKGYILQYRAQAEFFHYLLCHLFKETVSELYFNKYLNEFKDRLYLLIDKFQYIFESKDLYDASNDFFRSLYSKNVTYICVSILFPKYKID